MGSPARHKKTNVKLFKLPKLWVSFFSYRYIDEEMQCIYKDYQGERYVLIRNSWEPWYDFNYNSSHDKEKWVSMRLEALKNFINKFEIKPNVVVDIGGDRGQYIPNLGQEVSVLIDTSGKEPVKSVIRKFSLSEVYKPDLLFLSHVLEHVANPLATLKDLFSYSNLINLTKILINYFTYAECGFSRLKSNK